MTFKQTTLTFVFVLFLAAFTNAAIYVDQSCQGDYRLEVDLTMPDARIAYMQHFTYAVNWALQNSQKAALELGANPGAQPAPATVAIQNTATLLFGANGVADARSKLF